MLISGFSYEEVEKETGINRDTLRTMKCRALKQVETEDSIVAKDATTQTTVETVETHFATAETVIATKEETPESEKKQPLNADKTSVLGKFATDFVSNFHPADLLFYGVILIGCNGITKALHLVGLFVSIAMFGVAVISLHGLKTLRGWARLPHGFFLLLTEAGFFVSDVIWANNALWANIGSLPLDIWANKYRNDLGEVVMLYGGSDVDKPFYIAIGVASVLFACAAYACIIALQGRKD